MTRKLNIAATSASEGLNIKFEDPGLSKIQVAINQLIEQMNEKYPVVICFVDKSENYRFVTTTEKKEEIHQLLDITNFSLMKTYEKPQ
mgnify:CR=1 FL=1|jgi:cystathionine beta-lyase family protein involved in aluminum resistance